nr:MAG TPA: hypothetical protein [Caudoviricetes sp.]
MFIFLYKKLRNFLMIKELKIGAKKVSKILCMKM